MSFTMKRFRPASFTHAGHTTAQSWVTDQVLSTARSVRQGDTINRLALCHVLPDGFVAAVHELAGNGRTLSRPRETRELTVYFAFGRHP
jgi:hypothetical protein